MVPDEHIMINSRASVQIEKPLIDIIIFSLDMTCSLSRSLKGKVFQSLHLPS